MADTHSTTVKPYLIVCLMAFAVFVGMAVGVRVGSPVTSIDVEVAESLHENQQQSPRWTHFFDNVKELAGLQAMIGVVLIVLGLLVYYGRYWLAIAWGCAVEGAAVGNDMVLKDIFRRDRPPFGRPKSPTDWSFPSGHSLRGFVMYGFLAYLIVHYLPPRWVRLIGVTAMVTVVVLIGFSRIYLGKHYLSDVVGGFAFGAGWLAAWIAVIELMGWRHRRQSVPAPTGNAAESLPASPSANL
jgi:undecaprenyl-diphosphatase